jgi:hypothetical protein
MLDSVGWFLTDVSGLHIGPILKSQDVKAESSWTSWNLKMGPTRSPEKSVQNQPTLCNIPEDDRIQVNPSGSLSSRKPTLTLK